LLAAGYTSEELAQSVCETQWPQLLRPVFGSRIPGIGRHVALLTRRGLYKSARLEHVWGGLLSQKGVVTFGDLRPGSLGIIVTDLTHSRGVLMPEALPSYGHDPASFPIARAVRMSAAVPFLFTPVSLVNLTNGDRSLMADGAMTANFPVGVVSRNHPVFGFRLSLDGDAHSNTHTSISGPFSLARSVVIAGIRARYALPRAVEAGIRLIHVPVRADLDFEMTGIEARKVFERARAAVASQLSEGDRSTRQMATG
jgi:NTE family protein